MAIPARAWLPALLGLASACTTSGPPKFWRDAQNRLVVEGPLLGPVDTLETLGLQLCGALHERPGVAAGNRRGGQEYCGVIYQHLRDERFYASHPSTLGPPLEAPGGGSSATSRMR